MPEIITSGRILIVGAHNGGITGERNGIAEIFGLWKIMSLKFRQMQLT